MIWNMEQLWMTRELVSLEVDFASVDLSDSYATFSNLRNKSQMPDTAKK